MEFETYTWEQVRAYAIISLNNLMNSANDIDLKGIKMCIDPLQTIHSFFCLLIEQIEFHPHYTTLFIIFRV